MDEWMMGCAEGLCRRVRSRKGSCPTVRSDGAVPWVLCRRAVPKGAFPQGFVSDGAVRRCGPMGVVPKGCAEGCGDIASSISYTHIH